MKNVVIVAHKYLTQPDDELVLFLNTNKYQNILHIKHSFSDADNRRSYFSWYKGGILYKESKSKDYQKLSEPLVYIKEMFFTLKWVISSNLKWDYYIGMDGLCTLFGNTLRLMRKVNKTIYWAIDFVPNNRFKGSLKNIIYHFINIQGYKKSNEMWDLSPRMAEAREKFLNIRTSNYKKHRVVPQGVWTERIKKYTYQECQKHTLVYMGHLLPKQGVQLVIEAIPEIVKKIPDFTFKIIGGGSYQPTLQKLAVDLRVIEHCDFKGKIDNIEDLEDEISVSCLAIAPYIKKLDTWTYYADPGKIKTYLACGVPTLLTDIPWNAKDIEKNNCGKIISENKENVAKNVLALMLDEVYNEKCRKNAIAYSKNFDYSTIFNSLIYDAKVLS